MDSNNTSNLQKNNQAQELLATYAHFAQNTASFFINNDKKRAFRFKNDLYVEQKKIGDGSFSDVFLFKNETKNSHHALKILKEKTTMDALLQEFKMMKDVESQFVIKIEDFIKIDDLLCIMMEYANQGTLDSFLSKISQETMTINASQLLDLVCDIFSGLNVLHSKKIIHRDLKMDNLLVSNYQIKISDLGVATYLISKQFTQTKIGNILYAAPEKLDENDKYNTSSDIYSAGLITLQMLLCLKDFEIFKLKINQVYAKRIQDSPESLKSFIGQLLDNNPGSRPTAINAFNLARMLKYDQEVLAYINKKMNGLATENFSKKVNQLLSTSFSSSSFNFQNNQLMSVALLNPSSVFSSVDTLFQKGMEYYWNSNIEQAEEQFSIILEQNPVSVEGLGGRLLCGYQYQDWINKYRKYTKKWIQDQLKQIKQLNPHHYLYYFCQGIINHDLDSMNKCIQLKPSMVEAIVYKATILMDKDSKDEALKLGQQALEMSGNNIFVLRLLGYLYYDINKDTSEQFYMRALQINPKQHSILRNLSLNEKEENQLDKALEYIDRSLSVCPYYSLSIDEKTKLLQKKNQHKEVIDYLLNIFKIYGEQQFLFYNLVLSYHKLGDSQNTLLYFRKYLIYDESDTKILGKFADFYKNLKDYEKAKECYQKCIDKKDKGVFFDMYTLFESILDQEEKGKQYLNELLKQEFDLENEEDCWYKLAALGELKKYKEFIDFSEIALNKHPSSRLIKGQIDILLEDEDKLEYLPLQFKLAEKLQSIQGICLETTLCKLKYFTSNEMANQIIPQILKYYEYQVNNNKQKEDNFEIPKNLRNYINKDNLKDLFTAFKKLYETNPNNLIFLKIFISLITLKHLKLPNDILEGIDKVYKANKIFENHSDKQLTTYYKFLYTHYKMHYYKAQEETSKIKQEFLEILKINDRFDVDLSFKKRFKSYLQFLCADLNNIIIDNARLKFKEKEIDFYKILFYSAKDECIKLFPNTEEGFEDLEKFD